jgi:arylsulfatase A-like enzyme
MKPNILFLAVAMTWLGTASETAAADKPHIVIILADDMGYGDVSCFNPDSKIPTTHIDRLAAEGVRFTDGHSGGSSCIPSRYALMTGRFATRKKMSLSEGPLIEEGRTTLPSLLRDQGYATAMVGKWHLGFDPFLQNRKAPADYSRPLRGGPVDRGFDTFFGMHASLDLPPYFYIRGREPVMPPTDDVAASTSVGGPEGWNRIQGAFWRAGKVAPDFKHTEVTPRLVNEAVQVIQTHATKQQDKPLFLSLALPSPHTPWLPLEQFRGKSGAGMYGDFVLQVDAAIGQVLQALQAAGMKENTLVLFSSDNGPVWYDKDVERFGHRSAGPLRGMKFDSWEGGHRMPFIIRWPAKVAPGRVCEQTVVFSDVLATFAGLTGATIPEGMAEDSVSFLPYLVDSNKAPEKRAAIIHDRRTIRDGDWKLILPRQRRRANDKATAELYNLKTDLSEQHNLISEHPEIADRLKGDLSSWLER